MAEETVGALSDLLLNSEGYKAHLSRSVLWHMTNSCSCFEITDLDPLKYAHDFF